MTRAAASGLGDKSAQVGFQFNPERSVRTENNNEDIIEHVHQERDQRGGEMKVEQNARCLGNSCL